MILQPDDFDAFFGKPISKEGFTIRDILRQGVEALSESAQSASVRQPHSSSHTGPHPRPARQQDGPKGQHAR